MNTILGILEDAQKTSQSHVTHTKNSNQENEAGSIPGQLKSNGSGSGGAGVLYLDNFFNLKPQTTRLNKTGSELGEIGAGTDTKRSNSSTLPLRPLLSYYTASAYRSSTSNLIGKDILQYIIIRCLNDRGVSERGDQGGANLFGIYQQHLQLIQSHFDKPTTSSRYKSDDTLTMNGSLDRYQAINMHFMKRPSIAVKWLLQEVDQWISLDAELSKRVSNTSSFQGQEVNFEYKLPLQFLYTPKIHNPSDPTLISPIYTKYDLAPLRHRQYLVQLPFILNDSEVISRVLIENDQPAVDTLQRILYSQSLEGFKLYECLVKTRLLKTKEDDREGGIQTSFTSLTDPVIKAGISTKSNLLSRVNSYSRKVPKSFHERTFDESKALLLLEQQFNVYASVWYRLSPQDTTQWCHNLVDHYNQMPLSLEQLQELEHESMNYFKFQLRTEKVHKMIIEEKKLTKLTRSLLTLPNQRQLETNPNTDQYRQGEF